MAQFNVQPTRFAGLGICKIGKDWRFVDCSNPSPAPSTIGGFYRSKAEILADCTRFAAERGF